MIKKQTNYLKSYINIIFKLYHKKIINIKKLTKLTITMKIQNNKKSTN